MSSYPPVEEPPKAFHNQGESGHYDDEKGYVAADGEKHMGMDAEGHVYEDVDAPRALHRKLQGRHMQMIAVGGAIGAGLFVGSGSALYNGGPASLVICYLIVGIFLLMVMQALAELGVMYPVNGAFFNYTVRFIDPAWGFAVGWDYAINWLTVLPFEITAAGITLQFWKASRNINIGAWVTIFLFALVIIQFFGVRGYGEVEFVLSIIKITAIVGFIILGIIIDCGGVPGGPPYIGAKYWYGPVHNPGATAFKHGFLGFCKVFTNASFAYGGTELTGLAAAEAADPLKSIPRAAKQVLWRIALFYVVSLLLVGLIVPSDAHYLLSASGSNTKYSPFVGAIKTANIKVLPSIFNFVITISVLSVANSCAYGSTRTMQALAATGMGPRWLAYVDKKGRPVWCVAIQIAFGFLAYINEATNAGDKFFTWLLALSGVANFFIWGSILVAHIRFRSAWKYNGRTLDEIPYRAQYGVIGSYFGLLLAFLCIAASFGTSLHGSWEKGGGGGAEYFFENWLTGPVLIVLYLFWKVWSGNWWPLMTPISKIDVTSGMRMNIEELRELAEKNRMEKTWATLPMRAARNLF